MINNKTILITGGTGSFGSVFIEHLLKNYNPKKLLFLAGYTETFLDGKKLSKYRKN